jgi:hypothetical protein
MERYRVVAGRIRQALEELDLVVRRVDRALEAAGRAVADQDLMLDSVALNLHDFYVGTERIFEHIASSIDRSLPSGSDWHRELLRQMTVDVPGLRPAVVGNETAKAVDEYLRFRHVVRNVYAFELDAERLGRLGSALRSTFGLVKSDLEAFATFLEQVGPDS